MSNTEAEPKQEETKPDSRLVDRAPFDESNKDADIILRTSDQVDFYVHKFLLSLISPVFATTFSLPQIIQSDGDEVVGDHRVVLMSEDSTSLFALLTWCDPRCMPKCRDLGDIQTVLRIADKYDMENVIRRVGEILRGMVTTIEEEPLKVYAIAIQYQLQPDVARVAARKTLRLTLEERANISELKHISGTALQNLHDYYFSCVRAVQMLATDFDWVTDMEYVWGPANIESLRTGVGVQCANKKCGTRSWRNWWIEYMRLAAEELYKRPQGATVMWLSDALAAVPLAMASSCSICRGIAFTDLHRFSGVFAAEIEKKIDQVW